MPTGKTAPSIRAALVIEPNEPLENQDHDDDKTMIDEDLATQFVDDQPMDMVNLQLQCLTKAIVFELREPCLGYG